MWTSTATGTPRAGTRTATTPTPRSTPADRRSSATARTTTATGVNGRDGDRDGFESAEVGGDDCDDATAWVRPGGTWPDPDGDGAIAAHAARDVDCDGHLEVVKEYDCAEGNHSIPRPEDPTPTGVDEDCDGLVDEGTVAYDDDGDGLAELEGDCDDTDPGVRPGRDELPDCRDQDCDGEVDEGVVRPRRDDPFEPDDDAAHELPGPSWASGLFGGRWRSSTDRLPLVTRGRDDVERFRVDAHDGTFDTFYVTVEVERMGDDQIYEISIDGPGGSRTGVLASPGRVSVGGGGRP